MVRRRTDTRRIAVIRHAEAPASRVFLLGAGAFSFQKRHIRPCYFLIWLVRWNQNISIRNTSQGGTRAMQYRSTYATYPESLAALFQHEKDDIDLFCRQTGVTCRCKYWLGPRRRYMSSTPATIFKISTSNRFATPWVTYICTSCARRERKSPSSSCRRSCRIS